jgi:hypothetical protein
MQDILLSFIKKGFRVYDGYFLHVGEQQGGDYPAKFSVLSKKPMNKKSMQKLLPVSNGYVGVVKNTHANNCQYITFNGSDVYAIDEKTGSTLKPDFIAFDRSIKKYYSTAR